MPAATRRAPLPDGLNATEQAHFGAANVSLLSQYPSMTDGTGADRRPAHAGQRRQPGQLPARPARLGGLHHQRRRPSCTAPASTCSATSSTASRPMCGRRSPTTATPATRRSRRPTRAARRCSTSRATTACCTPSTPAPSTADPLGGKEAWAMIPSIDAAEALQARRQQLQGQPPVLRRRHARRQRHVRHGSAPGRRSWSAA